MINRNNIEEWLLLYADDELSQTEREAVEYYLNENPDLKQELLVLQELRFIPEPMSNPELLTSLYMPSLSQQDISAIIDYTDGEGSVDERQNTKQKIETDPEWKEYHQIILNSTLKPDLNIAFTNKTSLYRKDRPAFTVMNMNMLMRAAAILLLIAGGIWMSIEFNKQKTVVKDNKRENQINKTENNTAVLTPNDTVTLVSTQKETPRSSSNEHIIAHKTGFNREEVSDFTERISEETNTVIENEIEEIAEVKALEVERLATFSTDPPILNAAQNENLQIPGQVYMISSSEINESPNKIQRVFKQVRRTFNRRVNHIIGDEPLRISIIQIKNK